jgi:hypothetical protein
VAGTVDASWTSGGTITSSEANTNFTQIYYGGQPGSPPPTSGTTLRGVSLRGQTGH